MEYVEQQRELVDGIPSSCLMHIQAVEAAGNVYPFHYHNYIEILYSIEGEYDVVISGRHYTFGVADMLIINSKEVHQINAISPHGGSYFVLRFEPEILYSSMFHNHREYRYVLPFLFENDSHQKVISAKDLKDTFLPTLLYEIYDEFEHKEYGYEFALKNDIGRIFLWLLRYFYKSGAGYTIPAVQDEMMKRLQPAFAYVLEHYDDEIKTEEMATLCNMSFSYFSRVFNQQMKMNFNEYVNRIRLMEAEKLLVSTTMTVTEIASAVGLSTTSYFIKLFKEHKDVTPKQFRKGESG